MSGIEPVTVYSQEWSDDGNFSIRAKSYYPDEVLNEMARRVGDKLDKEILARLGYAKVVRCRDCKYYADHEWVLVTDVCDVCHFWHGEPTKVAPDGYCAWGVCKEEHE